MIPNALPPKLHFTVTAPHETSPRSVSRSFPTTGPSTPSYKSPSAFFRTRKRAETLRGRRGCLKSRITILPESHEPYSVEEAQVAFTGPVKTLMIYRRDPGLQRHGHCRQPARLPRLNQTQSQPSPLKPGVFSPEPPSPRPASPQSKSGFLEETEELPNAFSTSSHARQTLTWGFR